MPIPKKRVSIKSRLKSFFVYCIRLDKSGRIERLLLTSYLKKYPYNLRVMQRYAAIAELQGDMGAATLAWLAIARQSELTDAKVFARARSYLENLDASVEAADQQVPNRKAPIGVKTLDPLHKPVDALEAKSGDLKHNKDLIDTAMYLAQCQRYNDAEHLVNMVRGATNIRYYDIHLLRIYLHRLIQEDSPDAHQAISDWWRRFYANESAYPSKLDDAAKLITLRAANRLLNKERHQCARRLLKTTENLQVDSPSALKAHAWAAEQRGDWEDAAKFWQFLAARQNPVRTKNEAVVPRNPAMQANVTKFALARLRNARTKLATQYFNEGNFPKATELLARVVESTADQRILKGDADLVQLIGSYVSWRLGVDDPQSRESISNLRTLVICLDVLKISGVHTHSGFILSIAKSLLDNFEDLKIHFVVTNERFVATTPSLSSSFYPSNEKAFKTMAKEVLGKNLSKRFEINYYDSIGLEGLVDTSKSILALKPDVVLYGGGHRGLYSNESRLVRHALYKFVPTSFFFIQSNNEVDESIDVIIARGPHEIEGKTSSSNVRVQPYPTIVQSPEREIEARTSTEFLGKIIVSAVAGVRLSLKLQAIEEGVLSELLGILDDNPGTVWHIVGSSDPKALIASVPLIAQRVKRGQVKVHPVLSLENFTDLVAKSDLFLHLPGFTGGSGGAGIARRNGVPILTFSNSDVAGRQPQETVFSETEVARYCEMASRILQDQKFAANITEKQFSTSDSIFKTAANGFYDCLSESIEIFKKRNTANEK